MSVLSRRLRTIGCDESFSHPRIDSHLTSQTHKHVIPGHIIPVVYVIPDRNPPCPVRIRFANESPHIIPITQRLKTKPYPIKAKTILPKTHTPDLSQRKPWGLPEVAADTTTNPNLLCLAHAEIIISSSLSFCSVW
jgi:hypothetical protein